MEVIFENFSEFFPNSPEHSQRKGDNAHPCRPDIRRPVEQRQADIADHPEVQPAARGQSRRNINAHHAAARQHGPDEQRRRGRQPEQQIQHTAQPLQPHAHPDHPQQVIHQPQPQPKCHRSGQRHGLSVNIDPHSAQQTGKESALRPQRLIGQGINGALHL